MTRSCTGEMFLFIYVHAFHRFKHTVQCLGIVMSLVQYHCRDIHLRTLKEALDFHAWSVQNRQPALVTPVSLLCEGVVFIWCFLL